jgi:hypothetical protein
LIGSGEDSSLEVKALSELHFALQILTEGKTASGSNDFIWRAYAHSELAIGILKLQSRDENMSKPMAKRKRPEVGNGKTKESVIGASTLLQRAATDLEAGLHEGSIQNARLASDILSSLLVRETKREIIQKRPKKD